MTLALTLSGVAVLAAVHILSVRLDFLDTTPRHRWMSFAGGVAVALVFLEIMPSLAEGQEAVEQAGGLGLGLHRHVYLLALAGLMLVYVIHRVVERSQGPAEESTAAASEAASFWLSTGVFATKSLVVGYLLPSESQSVSHAALFVLAIGLELLVADRALHADHGRRFERRGRWVLAAAVAAGAAAASLAPVSPLALVLLRAFLGGAIILTVLREELPKERQSRLWPFALGIVLYGGLRLVR